MPLQIKDGAVGGGTWRAAPTSGKLAIKTGGAWRIAAAAKIKDGPVGGGVWRDSGYVGLPGNPSTPSVVGWNYYDVHVVWGEPTTGAPIASFEAQLLDSNNNVLQTQVPVEAGPNSTHRNDYVWRALQPNGYYQMRARTKSVSGLYSNWTAPVRVKMGQAEIHTPRGDWAFRPWYNNAYCAPNDGRQGEWMVCYIPGYANSHTMRVQVWLINGSQPFCGTAVRRAIYIHNTTEIGDVGYKENGWDETLGWGGAGDTLQGIALRGNGWWVPNNCGGEGWIHLWGDEIYWYTWTDVTPAVPNSYW
jgi:hypothetical protein